MCIKTPFCSIELTKSNTSSINLDTPLMWLIKNNKKETTPPKKKQTTNKVI